MTEEELAKIPEEERWLWRNPEALASVLRGIKQAADGKVAPYPERQRGNV